LALALLLDGAEVAAMTLPAPRALMWAALTMLVFNTAAGLAVGLWLLLATEAIAPG
jgi:hypothetical protein